MLQGILTTNAWYDIDQETIDATRRIHGIDGSGGQRSRKVEPKPVGISAWAQKHANEEIMSVLSVEFRRRRGSDGNGNSSQWLNTAAGDIGGQLAAFGA